MKKLYITSTLILLTLTLLSGLALASTSVSADDVVDDVTITVPMSCTMTGTGQDSHTASINPGTYNSSIGLTTIKAFCNDHEGFAIYAIGYTDEEDGKNVLTSSALGSTSDITTSTATSGNNSAWAMKLSVPQSPTPTYPMTIQSDTEGSFSSFHTVPDDYTLVAKRTSSTDIGQNAEGSSLTTTYQAYISQTQPAGTYTGKVKYTMVHPHDAPAPFRPHEIACEAGKICYQPNADITDSMGDQTVESSDTEAVLWASNFQRPGYGFAGWTDKYDWQLNQNDQNGNGTGSNAGYHIYGPNETITAPDDITTSGLSLYAVWAPSAGDLQGWIGCSNLNTGQITALTDARDNNTYAVAKLKDNKCWMVENLRLDNQYTTSAENIAKAQGYNSSFIGLADPETAHFSYNDTTTNSLYSTDGSTSAPAITGSNQGYRFPRYNNQNTANPATNMTAWNNDSNTYSVGNYYTWAAAIADTSNCTNESYNTTSICPTDWHIPTGGSSSKEYDTLNTEQNGGSTSSSAGLRAYPANFIYSGRFIDSSEYYRGRNGGYWSSSVYGSNSNKSYLLSIGPYGAGSGNNYKDVGYSIRCSYGF